VSHATKINIPDPSRWQRVRAHHRPGAASLSSRASVQPYRSGVGPNLIAALTSVVVIMITVIGQWISSRNDRNLTNQELDILKKLDPNSKTARDLSEVIQARIAKWRQRIAQSRRHLRGAIWWAVAGYVILIIAISYYMIDAEGKWAFMVIAILCFGGAVGKLLQWWPEWRHERQAEDVYARTPDR
jgi:hypothetical protein